MIDIKYEYRNDKPQVIINEVLKRRNITVIEFRKLCYDALIKQSKNTNSCNTHINEIIRTTSGRHKMTCGMFELIMSNILKEPILDDPDIIHFMRLRKGKDLLGMVFGRWTVVECMGVDEVKHGRNKLYWRCKCECGNENEIEGVSLTSGNSTSCGCYTKERQREAIMTHGKSGTREYRTWASMMHRCYDIKTNNYHNYGGRGITVCDRWRESFDNFYEDMGDRPEDMTLDRENNNGNYEPNNCRWATNEEQMINQRKTLRFKDGTPVSQFISDNKNVLSPYHYFHAGYSQEDILNKFCNEENIE